MEEYYICEKAGKFAQCKKCVHNKPHFFTLPRFNTEKCTEKGICIKTGLFSVKCIKKLGNFDIEGNLINENTKGNK